MRFDTTALRSTIQTFPHVAAKRSHLFVWAALLVLACLFGLQLLRGSVLYDRFVQDAFIHLNGIKHIEAGNLPHVGFTTPIGAFYYLAFYLTTYFAPPSAYTAVYANGLVAGLAAGLCLLAGYRRLRAGWIAVLTLYVGIIVLSPRHLGDIYVSFNAAYNRWAWAILAVLAVVVSLPRVDSENNRAALADGLLSALLVTLLFFTKATYAIVGLGLIIAGLATVRRNQRAWLYGLIVAASIALLVLAVELAFGIVGAYLSDLMRTAQAQEGSRVRQLLLTVYFTGADLILVLLIAAASSIAATRMSLDNAVYLLVLTAGGVAVAAQNNIAYEMPIIPVTALIGLMMFSRNIVSSDKGRYLLSAAAAAVLFLFLRPMLLDTASIAREALVPSSPGADVDWLQGTSLKNFALQARTNTVLEGGNCTASPPTVVEDREYLSVLHDGVRLLGDNGASSSRVLPLTWTNPFPVLLGVSPGRHELSWWDPGRTFTSSVHPRPELLFQDIDYIMIPKFEWGYFSRTPQLMLDTYGMEIRRRYRTVGETGCWVLMKKVSKT